MFFFRSRPFSAKVSLIVIGIVLPLFTFELAVRSLGPIMPGNYQTAAFTSAESAGPQNRPYAAGYKRTSEFTTAVRINSKRLRGPEINYAKPANTYRTLVLGDSYMFALQVDEHETFAMRLAEYLTQTTGADLAFEVINGGADGWSTVNEYAWLVTEGYRYDPDLVVLAYFIGNDPGENADRVGGIAPGGRVLPRDLDNDLWHDGRRMLSERSALWNIFEFGVLAKFTAPSNERISRREDGVLRDPSSDRKARGWALSEDLLGLMRDYCEQRGLRLMIVSIPMAAQLDDEEADVTPILDLGRRINVPAIDLLPSFKREAHGADDPLYFPKDQHWTAGGHDLAARIVAAELRGKELVPGRATR